MTQSSGHPTSTQQRPILGIASALGIVCIWSGWLIVSRIGATSELTIYDIAALRYGVSGLVALPIVLYLKPWRGVPLSRILVLSVLGGAPYVLLSYAAFTFAPAAHGGVFMNGVLPAITLVAAWLILREKPRSLQIAGAALIILGTILAAIDARESAAATAWIGDILFLAAAVCFSIYMILNRIWNVRPPLVLLSIAVVSALGYLPIWYLLLPTNLAAAPMSQIVLQAAYQGLLPNLIGMNLLTVAVRHIGPSPSSAVMSIVPSTGAILGVLILGEHLGPLAWVGIIVITCGILLTALRPPRLK